MLQEYKCIKFRDSAYMYVCFLFSYGRNYNRTCYDNIIPQENITIGLF